MSEKLPVINDTSAEMTYVVSLNQYHAKPCNKTLAIASFIQTLKIRSPMCFTEAWIWAFEKKLFANQYHSNLVVMEQEDIFTVYKRKPLEES